jgi:hypothetical protein
MGGTLSNHDDIEMFPLRSASESEGKTLKRCLKAAHQAQEEHKQKTGKYARRVRELPIDGDCSGVLLAQSHSASGYEIRGEIREDDTTVRWSVNEKGVIEEHLDPSSDLDLEL